MNFNITTPETTQELLAQISKHQENNFRFGAGYTDLLLELKKQPDEDLTVINLAQLNDEHFTSISELDDGIRVGTLVTANRITYNEVLEKRYPVLYEAASKLASRQIRQVATIGGNLCTASPAGDIACALVALEARCEMLKTDGTVIVVPIDDFFVGVKKNCLLKNEILRSIIIPSNSENSKLYSGFIKVGTRCSMEIAVVSLAYHIQSDENGKITKAGVAIGSVAPTIKFAKSASEYLIGRSYTSIGTSKAEEFATKVLEYTLPISDIRASAWYRKEALFNISKSIFESN
ncbi:MAG: FAD binding domain-containing protein [Candidatus Hatepunaea meridiana]|nr:FAD binding domain-containing protein [Candidatus Hatepunaea meridiana]